MSLSIVRETLFSSLKHPAARFFILLYSVSMVALALTSGGNFYTVIVQLILTGVDLLFLGITLVVTPRIPPQPQEKDSRLNLQIAFVGLWLLVVLLVPQIGRATSLDGRILNPLVYAIIPVFVLVIGFGVMPKTLGFQWGYRSLIVAGIWISINVLFVIVQLLTGSFSVTFVLSRLVGNILQNGFVEEIFWRGIVFTRLRQVFSLEWGAVLSALLFGSFHLQANMSMFDENIVAAVAFCIVSQARFGLMMNILLTRTRSLLAPGLVHTFSNLNPVNFL